MKFTPSDNYHDLKRQALALARIVDSIKKVERYYRERSAPAAAQTIERLRAEIDSERQANAILTEENHELRNRVSATVIDEDTYEQIQGTARELFRKSQRGVRGQQVTMHDSHDYWIMVATRDVLLTKGENE